MIYTGAGVSTSAGIPDFRGPKGVWTLEKKGEKPKINVSWDEAHPTKTHMAINHLTKLNKCQFVVSQNIDGLHLRSGLDRQHLAELHGNMFVDECTVCKRMFVRHQASSTVGRKISNNSCLNTNGRRPCRGKLRDFVLDWEDELPEDDLSLSHSHSMLSELSIVIGSTLQIIPAGNMPIYCKKRPEGKLVIINLQPTKHDKKADLIIHAFADKVFQLLFEKCEWKIPEYQADFDPVKKEDKREWTQSHFLAKEWEKKSTIIEQKLKEKRKLEKLMKKEIKESPEKKVKVEIKTD